MWSARAEEKHSIYVLIAVISIIVLIVSIINHFPYADGVNHIARYKILHDVIFNKQQTLYDASFELIPTSYLLLDFLAICSLNFIDPHTLGKLISILAAIMPILGLTALASSVNSRNKSLVIATGGILSFNWYYFYGFMNYLIGLGLALLVLAWWWKYRDSSRKSSILFAAIYAALLYLTHLTSLSIVLVVTWLYGGLAIIEYLRNKKTLTQLFSVWLIPLSLFITGILLFLYTRYELAGNLPIESKGIFIEFRDPVAKIKQFFSPFFSFSVGQMLVMFLGWAMGAGYVLYKFYKKPSLNVFALSSVVFILLFLLFPAVVYGAYDADVRFLLPALMTWLIVPTTHEALSGFRHYVTGIVFLMFILHASIVYSKLQVIEEGLDDYAKIIEELPKQSKVVAIVTQGSKGRVDPYRHYILWHVINNSGWSNGLFHRKNTGSHMGHFIVKNIPYSPPENWKIQPPPTIEWKSIKEQFEYVIVVGDVKGVKEEANIYATFMVNKGSIYLYKLVRVRAGEPNP